MRPAVRPRSSWIDGARGKLDQAVAALMYSNANSE
jgi:hypothetical protein